MKIYGVRKLGFIVFMILVVCIMQSFGWFNELVSESFKWFSGFYLGANVAAKIPKALSNFTIQTKQPD